MKKRCLSMLLCFYSVLSFSQTIQGLVKDEKGNPIFAANVYFKLNLKEGVATNFEGEFRINYLPLKPDTLVVSYIGYIEEKISLSNIDPNQFLTIILKEKTNNLGEVIIEYSDPISEQFSVVKMDILKDVYLNPVAQGDPLKAITFLPASSNVDETANVSLRGSSPDRSRVILNGVPVINPVRATNLNNQGFFSLFNPEIIDKQYVYASNPPLTYGNTSAGLVEIETKKKLSTNQLQTSISIANLGFLASQNVKKDKLFIQLYGNYQVSDAFIAIQKKQFVNVEKFDTKDIGFNINTKLNKKVVLNSFNYFINENFTGKNIEVFTYKGKSETIRKRFFSINNLSVFNEKSSWKTNVGISLDKNDFEYGNIQSENYYNNIFISSNYQWFFNKIDLQVGATYEYHSVISKDSIPDYYYALSPALPNTFSEDNITNQILESYAYAFWEFSNKWNFSSGIRSNIPLNKKSYYLNWQFGVKFNPSDRHQFLLSGGRYTNYSVPNFFDKSFNLLKSYQIALDYTFQNKNTLLTLATYFKNETGVQNQNFFSIDEINTFGIEFFIEQSLFNFFTVKFSNSFINQEQTILSSVYPGLNDFNYFIKTSIQYNNPKLFSFALIYTTRPGIYYNSVNGGSINPSLGFYEPSFSERFYDKQYDSYNRIDLSISKYIPLKKQSLVIFASVNNILNTKNQREAQYNLDYTQRHFDYYQLRNIYFGLVWQLNY